MNNTQQETFNQALNFLKANTTQALVVVDVKTDDGGSFHHVGYTCNQKEAIELMDKAQEAIFQFLKTKEVQRYPDAFGSFAVDKIGEHFDHVLIVAEQQGKVYFYHNETVAVGLGLCMMANFRLKNETFNETKL